MVGPSLRRMGADAHTTEDVLQDVAAGLLRRPVAFEDVGDLARWVHVAARNRYIDLLRRRRHVALDEVLEEPATLELETEVVNHDVLRALSHALDALSPDDRTRVLSAANGSPVPKDKSEARREYVRRFRARARLLAMVEAVLSVVAFGLIRSRTRPRVEMALGAVAVAVAVATLNLVPQVGGDSPGARPVIDETRQLAGTAPGSEAPSKAVVGSRTGSSISGKAAGAAGGGDTVVYEASPVPLPGKPTYVAVSEPQGPRPLACQTISSAAPPCVHGPLYYLPPGATSQAPALPGP